MGFCFSLFTHARHFDSSPFIVAYSVFDSTFLGGKSCRGETKPKKARHALL